MSAPRIGSATRLFLAMRGERAGELADRLGWTSSSVSRWLNGQRDDVASYKQISELAVGLGIHPDDLRKVAESSCRRCNAVYVFSSLSPQCGLCHIQQRREPKRILDHG